MKKPIEIKLKKIESLATQTSLQGNEANSIQSIADDIISSSSANNSIYLKSSSSSGQEALKCHLLATHRNNCTKSDISTLELNQEVAKTHYLVSSSKDLAIAKEVLLQFALGNRPIDERRRQERLRQINSFTFQDAID